jgi:hypothetical protein
LSSFTFEGKQVLQISSIYTLSAVNIDKLTSSKLLKETVFYPKITTDVFLSAGVLRNVFRQIFGSTE